MSLPLPVQCNDLETFANGTARSVGLAGAPIQVKRKKNPWTRLHFKLKMLKGLTKKVK